MYKFTMQDVRKAYDELDRRIEIEIREGGLENEQEIKEYRNAMLQGLYGTLMVLASNWPDVRCEMIDAIEEERHWRELGYVED